jgi:hypothetical protein
VWPRRSAAAPAPSRGSSRSRIGPDTLRRLHARAPLMVRPKATPYFRDPIDMPPVGLELFFDIETDPLRNFCYLHGFVVRRNGEAATERFVSFFAEAETAAREAAIVRSLRRCREALGVAHPRLLREDAREVLRLRVARHGSVRGRRPSSGSTSGSTRATRP